jgi:hypothetical protein
MPDPRRCDRGGHDHGGGEGTCGDPFGLLYYQPAPRPATTRRSPENRPHAAPRGRQILVWAPGEDGPNLRRTTPKNPVRLTAGEPACSRPIGPWGSSAPRGTPAAFPSLARESLVLRPEGRLNLTAATAGCATHRPAVRRPDPSALLAGTPTRISRSNRVGPSGHLSTLGAQEVAVKATFPPAGRICPAHDRLNYFNGISGDEPSRPRAKRARVPTGSVAPPPQPWRARSRPGPGCAAPSTSRLRPQGAAQLAPTRTPVPGPASRHTSRVIAAGTARWSHPYRPCALGVP